MKKMTSRQRLMAAIEGRPVDIVPVAPRIWRYGVWKKMSELELARRFDFDLISFYGGLGNGIYYMEAEQATSELSEVKLEIRKERGEGKTLITRTFFTPAGKLHDVMIQADGRGEYGISPNPEWREPLVKDVEDIEKLRYLLPHPGKIGPQLEGAKKMEAEIGDMGILAFRPTIGPDNMVLDALGTQRALTASVEEPELFDRLVQVADEWHMDVMRRILEAGFKIIFDVWFNFSLSTGWSPAFYGQKVFPLLKKHAELIHRYGAKMFHYDDGKLAGSIGCIIEAGADIVQTLTPPPAGDLDFSWLARMYGGKICLNGGIDTVRIRFGTPEEIEGKVREILEILGPTRRFILGTSDSITEHTPEENIVSFFQSARQYGKMVAEKMFG